MNLAALQTPWPFGSLVPFSYGAILADPAWSYEMWSEAGYERSPEAHYETMSDKEILDLPVEILAADDCALFLWAIWPKLPEALAVMKAWGFTYKTGGAWAKQTRTGKPHMGGGFIHRSTTEPYLIGTKGAPRWSSKSVRNLIEAPRREHSRKPDQMRENIHKMLPHTRKAELFAIEGGPGFETWNPKKHREAQSSEVRP